MRLIVLLAAIVAFWLIIRLFVRIPPEAVTKVFKWALVTAGGILLLYLLVTGRLHWLFAVIAAMVPLMKRLLGLFRYLPLLASLGKRFGVYNAGAGRPPNGQTSRVQSEYLTMILDHDTAAMDGEVIKGSFKGSRLSKLCFEDLILFLAECAADNDSQMLLVAYLEREHAVAWQSHAGRQNTKGRAGAGQSSIDMAVTEAAQILGLSADAPKDDIVAAHRRLMQKMHPDHGGSTYLAAKINKAKDILLK